MGAVTITGAKEIDRFLKTFPSKIRVSAIRAAARKAARPIIQNARFELSDDIVNTGGQSKAAYISRNIKAVTLRSKTNPGVYVGVKGKDLPVGNRYWDVRSYAILLGEGAYKAGVRKKRGNGASTGRFRGVGNFIEDGAKASGETPGFIFINGIHDEITKAILRS